MSEITVRELTMAELPGAGALLGRALGESPLHVRIAGADQARRQAMYAGVYGVMLEILHSKGAIQGAIYEEKLLGVCALIPPGKRELSGPEKFRLLAAVMKHAPLVAKLKAKKWADSWLEIDAREQTHWYLGPMAVEPEFQRRGVGAALLQVCCEQVDAQKGVVFLRTDQPTNVPFFSRFAFKTASESEVVDVPNWVMLRPAKHDSARWARPPTAQPVTIPKHRPK